MTQKGDDGVVLAAGAAFLLWWLLSGFKMPKGGGGLTFGGEGDLWNGSRQPSKLDEAKIRAALKYEASENREFRTTVRGTAYLLEPGGYDISTVLFCPSGHTIDPPRFEFFVEPIFVGEWEFVSQPGKGVVALLTLTSAFSQSVYSDGTAENCAIKTLCYVPFDSSKVMVI